MLVECPSGLTIVARKLKVAEANILADKQAQQRGATADSLLTSVWEETHDVGPYNFDASKPPKWEEVLVGDRFYAQVAVRIATHGAEYDFRVPCSVCKNAINWSTDLSALPKKLLSPEDAEVFRNGNRFEATAPDGRAITFHLMTGKHERKAQMLYKQSRANRITASLLSRIDTIEGVQNRQKYFDQLDFTEALDLVDIVDAHDCGLETKFDVECDECFAMSEVLLPLGAEFWSPSRRAMKTGT